MGIHTRLLQIGLILLLVTAFAAPAAADDGHAPTEVRDLKAATSWPWVEASREVPDKCTPPDSVLACVEDVANNVRVRDPRAIHLIWEAPEDRGTGGDPTDLVRYEIFRGTSPDELRHLDSVPPTQKHYRDGGLDPTENYFYRVRLVNDVGPGNFSDVACAAPGPWYGPLNAPTGTPCGSGVP